MSTARSEVALPDGARVPLVVLRHPRARRMRLRYDGANGEARLTLPPRAALGPALKWAQGHADWLVRQRARGHAAVSLGEGALLPLEGEMLRVESHPALGRRIERDGDVLRVGGPPELVGVRLERWLKARARDLLTAETQALAGRHRLPLSRVSIGDPKSRWGSCASSGAIRYSWRLILAPAFVRQATVAHEVAHLRHMNHGPDFHALVRQLSPSDPDAARAWLRREGAGLHRYRA